MRRNLSICLVVALALILVSSASGTDYVRHKIERAPLLKGDEPLPPDVSYYPSRPGLITDSPGEIIGWTRYDYQTNCSTGDRVVLGVGGALNFSWMNGIDTDPDGVGERQVYFNCVDANGNQSHPGVGVQISDQNRSGYTTIDNLSGDIAMVGYHRTNNAPNYELFAGVDAASCFGIFTNFPGENVIDGATAIWPYVTVDRNDNIHTVISHPDELGDAFGYVNSTDGGATWSRPVTVDTILTISPVTASSPVSDKVAIVYTHDVDSWLRNNVYYIESEDGLTWDMDNGKINITDYDTNDSLFAWDDIDAVYDYNDNLHIIWNAWWSVLPSSVYYPVWLYHYDTGSETITLMAESDTPDFGNCDSGNWNMPIAKMSLGVHEASNALFSVYTFFPEDDCAQSLKSNGELYMQYSADGGASWSEPENMTNSHTPGCPSGECDSDHWSTLAKRVDANLHITYINDKDAGGVVQGEGDVTENPVMYMTFPNPLTGIDDEGTVPRSFALSQNYPNPFNARTNIEFELLENSRVELSVYDITGAKVATLVNGEMEAGMHSVNWDAEKAASGVYYYSLKANGEESARKMTLLK